MAHLHQPYCQQFSSLICHSRLAIQLGHWRHTHAIVLHHLNISYCQEIGLHLCFHKQCRQTCSISYTLLPPIHTHTVNATIIWTPTKNQMQSYAPCYCYWRCSSTKTIPTKSSHMPFNPLLTITTPTHHPSILSSTSSLIVTK